MSSEILVYRQVTSESLRNDQISGDKINEMWVPHEEESSKGPFRTCAMFFMKSRKIDEPWTHLQSSYLNWFAITFKITTDWPWIHLALWYKAQKLPEAVYGTAPVPPLELTKGIWFCIMYHYTINNMGRHVRQDLFPLDWSWLYTILEAKYFNLYPIAAWCDVIVELLSAFLVRSILNHAQLNRVIKK